MKTEQLPKAPEWALCAIESCESDGGDARRNMIDGIKHEMDLHAEGQDGCITDAQFKEGKRILAKMGEPYAY